MFYMFCKNKNVARFVPANHLHNSINPLKCLVPALLKPLMQHHEDYKYYIKM